MVHYNRTNYVIVSTITGGWYLFVCNSVLDIARWRKLAVTAIVITITGVFVSSALKVAIFWSQKRWLVVAPALSKAVNFHQISEGPIVFTGNTSGHSQKFSCGCDAHVGFYHWEEGCVFIKDGDTGYLRKVQHRFVPCHIWKAIWLARWLQLNKMTLGTVELALQLGHIQVRGCFWGKEKYW
jgi:hypothetical protein